MCPTPSARAAPRPRRLRAAPRASRSVGGGPHRRLVAEAEPHEPALGLVRDRRAAQLGDDRDSRSRSRPRAASSALVTVRSSSTGTPCAASNCLESASDSVGIGRAIVGETRNVAAHDVGRRGDHRGLLRPAVDVGRAGRRDALLPRAGHAPLRLRARRTTRSTAPTGASPYESDDARRVRSARRRGHAAGRVRHLAGPVDRLRRPATIAPRSPPRSTRSSTSASSSCASRSTTSRSAAREQGIAHAELTTWLRDHLGDRAALVLVPTEYVGTAPTPYLDALADGRAATTCRSRGPARPS